jgi:copper chaperone NosL
LWSVRLVAPQYPEGLGMNIHVNAVKGLKENDLRSINSLNHYIGMKAIEPDTIPELKYMPWIVAGLIATGLGVAAAGRKKLLVTWAIGFVLIGAIGLADFWRWEHDYGTNLDLDDAIIVVPGMTYQPPLIGSKQLLNFRATSLPNVGGMAAGLSMLLVAGALFFTYRGTGGKRGNSRPFRSQRVAHAA